jgi:protein TonB
MRGPTLAACALIAFTAMAADAQPAPPTSATGAAVPPSVIKRPVWIKLPTARDYADDYPSAAVGRVKQGHVVMSCDVTADGRLDPCTITVEDPPGYGLGAAALTVAKRFQMGPADKDGAATVGRAIVIPITFNGHA